MGVCLFIPSVVIAVVGFFLKMAWQPEQEPVKELAGYLKDALNSLDQNAQRYATMVRQLVVIIFIACRPNTWADGEMLEPQTSR